MGVLDGIGAWSARRREAAKLRIAAALASGGEQSGNRLSEATGMGMGRLYPTLMAMEETGEISSRWREGPTPRTRLYSLPTAAA